MRPIKLWQRVGPPTWKRSGTLVFTAAMGVVLIGGTAMAANLGLLTSTTPGDGAYRLDVPRPALAVTLPTTEPAPPGVEPTTIPDDDDADADDGEIADDPPAAERSAGDEPQDADGPSSGTDQTPDRGAAPHDDADDHHHDSAESTSEREQEDTHRHRADATRGGWKGHGDRFNGDGRHDDD